MTATLKKDDIQQPMTLAERVEWAQRDVEEAARRVVQHANDPAYLFALQGRLDELTKARFVLANAPTNPNGRRGRPRTSI